MSTLVIKIQGDIADYEKALDAAAEETEALNAKLESTAKGAAVAFALLTAEAVAAVSAFAASQAATNKLTQALQQQGIYSKELVEDYRSIASAIQEKTGADDDAVVSAIASIQGMLGQTKVTQELAFAVSDLAEATGMDLSNAYNLVAKAATTNTGVLRRYGIEIEDAGNKSENLDRITAALAQKFGGQAEAAAKGLGGIKLLKNTFGDLQEEIGKRLAPAFETLINVSTKFLQFIQNNKLLIDFAVAAGVAAAAISGIVLAASLGSIALLKLQAALAAAGVAAGVMTIATRGLMAATGLGALITVAGLIALNWEQTWPRIVGIFQASVTTIGLLAKGTAQILLGLVTLDVAKFEEGEANLLGAVRAGIARYNEAVFQGIGEREAAEAAAEQAKKDRNDADAARREREEQEKNNRLLAIERQKQQLMVAQFNLESQEQIALKQEEIKLLEALEDEKNAAIFGKIQERLTRVRELQNQQSTEELEQNRILDDQILAQNEEFNALSAEQQRAFLEENNNQIRQSILTEQLAREQAAAQTIQAQVNLHNQFLMNQQKFGTAYALINRVMYSEVVQGAGRAFGELAALQQSSNATLKGIGKAAALANIAIRTAESAMNIYAGFSTIPIVGPALGVAGAAAAVAFGAEQAGKVTAAAKGGLLTGGIPGKDSIPVMAMPGELVVPTRNFDEVVNAVAASRAGGAQAQGEGGVATVVLQLKGELMDFIEAQMVERRNLNLSIQGV